MNSKTSTLNPNAAEYVPLFKRGAYGQNEGHNVSLKDSRSVQQHGMTHGYDHVAEQGAFSAKGQAVYGSHGSSAQKLYEMTSDQTMDDESIMDLEYLQMIFPGISDESITGAYFVNNGDVEATIDMLNCLEMDIPEPSENLPDTLDIGDVPEPAPQTEHGSLKLKNVAGESSTSSSAPSGSAVPA